MILALDDLNRPTDSFGTVRSEHERIEAMMDTARLYAALYPQRPFHVIYFPDPKSPAVAVSTHRKRYWHLLSTHTFSPEEVH